MLQLEKTQSISLFYSAYVGGFQCVVYVNAVK